MKWVKNTFPLLLFMLTLGAVGQKSLPLHPETGKVYYEGARKVKPKSKKKIYKKIEAWSAKKQDFPPIVFSTISSSKDSIRLKAVTEVPSSKRLHPISFKITLVVKKQSFLFIADGFYIEDINLSLDEWLEKYSASENERPIKNRVPIVKGIDSHVFLTFENLKKIINNEKEEK